MREPFYSSSRNKVPVAKCAVQVYYLRRRLCDCGERLAIDCDGEIRLLLGALACVAGCWLLHGHGGKMRSLFFASDILEFCVVLFDFNIFDYTDSPKPSDFSWILPKSEILLGPWAIR
jgi:hypothetical protein